MKELSALEIISKIRKKEQINAIVKGGFLQIKVTSYLPVIAIAMHGGRRIEREFADLLNLNSNERELAEESFTDFYIDNLPIQIIARDNKSIYDLSKNRENCINLNNFVHDLTPFQKKKIYKYYDDFHAILKELIEVISRVEKRVFLYDFHGKIQEKLIILKINNKSMLPHTLDLSKSFEESDFKLINGNFEIIEESNEFIKRLSAKHKKLNYIQICVKEVYKDKYKNNYYIHLLNRIRYMLVNSINNCHIEKVKEKIVRIEEY